MARLTSEISGLARLERFDRMGADVIDMVPPRTFLFDAKHFLNFGQYFGGDTGTA